MKDLKEQLSRLKPWIILITYAILLTFFVFQYKQVWNFIAKYLNYFTPLTIAIGFAYVLNIPLKKIEAFLGNYIKNANLLRGISIFFTVILTFTIIIFFGYIIIPQLINSVYVLIVNLGNYIDSLLKNIDSILAFFKLEEIDLNFDTNSINQFLSKSGLDINNILKNTTNIVSDAGVSIVNIFSQFTGVLATWFLAFMFSLYLLSSKELLIVQIKKVMAAIIPYKPLTEVLRVSRICNDIFTSFVSGQLVEAIIIGGLIYLMMIILNMPFAILIASITSVLSLVPVFGATLAMMIGAILILSLNPLQSVWFVIGYQVVQQFENSVIYPRVVGKSVGLPPLWTLVSIFIFGSMLGVIGMLIAVPLTACIYTIGSEYIHARLKRKGIQIVDNEVIKKC